MVVKVMEEMRAGRKARALPVPGAKENTGVTPRYRLFFFGVDLLRVVSICPVSG